MSDAEDLDMCESCGGKGRVRAFVDYADGSGGYQVAPCDECGGKGLVPLDREQCRRAGFQIQARRLGANRTLREEAERLGLTALELSRAERGRLDLARTRAVEDLQLEANAPTSAEDAALDAIVALCIRGGDEDPPGPDAPADPAKLSAEDRAAIAGLGDGLVDRLIAQAEADGGPPPLPRP